MNAHVVERRDAAVKRLLVLKQDGRLPKGSIQVAAVSLGVSERSVHRWMAAGGYEPKKREPWALTAEARQAFYLSAGVPKRAHDMLIDAGVEVRSLRVYYRSLQRELSAATRAYAREGEGGWRKHCVYLSWEPKGRNEVWEADHAQLDVHVVPLRGSRLQSPWMTVIVDACSRLIMGWALSFYPTSAEVLAALREAIVVDPERGPWGGVPHVVRFDGGRDFLATAVSRAAAEVGFLIDMTAPYSPYQKGKVERLHQTIAKELIAKLPHSQAGPRRADGKLYAQPRGPLTISDLQEEIDRYVRRYNRERKHSSLGGLTPEEKWHASTTILDVVEPDALRWMMMADQTRNVAGNGIRFQGEAYIAPELHEIEGRTVQIRYMPHDKRTIEVFTESGHFCTARPQGELQGPDRVAVLNFRHEAKRTAAKEKAKASRAAKARTEPLTGKTPVSDITLVTTQSSRRSGRSRNGLSHRESDELLDALGVFDELNTAAPSADQASGSRDTE
jgi:putative transposase